MHCTTDQEAHMFPIRSIAATTALVAISVALPAMASAHVGPGDVLQRQQPARVNPVRLEQLDRLGPKYVQIGRQTVAAVPPSGGTSWTLPGAGIGAAVLAVAMLAWLFARRRHRDDARPEAGRAVQT